MCGQSVVYDEPADWIVEQARQEGVSISRGQLAAYHRAGLIGGPHREFFGGRDGSESVYPHGTLRQAIPCSILMKQFGSIERVGWELSMLRMPVAEQHWRGPLRDAYEMFRLTSSFATDDADSEENSPELSAAADRLIDTLGDLPEAPHRMGVARRRLRRDGFKELLGIVTSAMIGAFKVSDGSAGESTDPIHILSRLVGAEPGRHKASVPPSPLLSVTGRAVAENLEAMAHFLPLIPRSISPDTITENELATARGEVSFLSKAYLSVRQYEARIVPGCTPDLALIRQLFERLEPKEQATLLLIWLAVRDVPGWRENLEALRQGVIAA